MYISYYLGTLQSFAKETVTSDPMIKIIKSKTWGKKRKSIQKSKMNKLSLHGTVRCFNATAFSN